MTEDFQKLHYSNEFIAYKQLVSKVNNLPTIVFCHGFKSDMEGGKAEFLHNYCVEHDLNYVRFDYFGHGSSSGEFADGSISLWLENVLLVIDKLVQGRVILIGSSMGSWLSLLAALARPSRISAIIGIASAPDFTEELLWDYMSSDARDELNDEGVTRLSLSDDSGFEPYHVTKHLIEDGRKHLLLNARININVPVILLHGIKDLDVPYETSIRIAKQLTSQQVWVVLAKDSDHRMSSISDLELLGEKLEKALSF